MLRNTILAVMGFNRIRNKRSNPFVYKVTDGRNDGTMI